MWRRRWLDDSKLEEVVNFFFKVVTKVDGHRAVPRGDPAGGGQDDVMLQGVGATGRLGKDIA